MSFWIDCDLGTPPIPRGANFSAMVRVQVQFNNRNFEMDGSLHRRGWWFLCQYPPTYKGPADTEAGPPSPKVWAWKEKARKVARL